MTNSETFMQDDFQVLRRISEYFSGGNTRPLTWRRQQLKQLKKLLLDNEEIILDALAKDLRKPAQEAWAMEFSSVTNDIDYNLSRLGRWSKPQKVRTPLVAQPGHSFVQAEPLGTVLIIGAWNYPLQLILSPLTSVISAGNCAVIKPSELAPATSQLLAKLVPQYLEPDAFAVVEGGVDETTALLKWPFNHILYTGNSHVGKIVMRAAAEHLTPVTLELGGKSPVYVDDSCDLETTASRIVWGKFTNAGQTCVAPDYILTTKETYKPLIEAIQSKIIAMYGDNPQKSDSYGRIVNRRHCERLTSYLDNLDDSNVVHGGKYDLDDCYLEPTIIMDPEVGDSIMQEEIFGPILPIVTVTGFDDAVDFICQRDKPLAAYLFSTNGKQQKQWVNQVSCGNQGINDTFMFTTVPELPFGGVGPSGMGQYSGKNGFDRFSHKKSVIRRLNIPDVFVRFAPYTDLKFKLLKMIR